MHSSHKGTMVFGLNKQTKNLSKFEEKKKNYRSVFSGRKAGKNSDN